LGEVTPLNIPFTSALRLVSDLEKLVVRHIRLLFLVSEFVLAASIALPIPVQEPFSGQHLTESADNPSIRRCLIRQLISLTVAALLLFHITAAIALLSGQKPY
jgi:hypothetical protein